MWLYLQCIFDISIFDQFHLFLASVFWSQFPYSFVGTLIHFYCSGKENSELFLWWMLRVSEIFVMIFLEIYKKMFSGCAWLHISVIRRCVALPLIPNQLMFWRVLRTIYFLFLYTKLYFSLYLDTLVLCLFCFDVQCYVYYLYWNFKFRNCIFQLMNVRIIPILCRYWSPHIGTVLGNIIQNHTASKEKEPRLWNQAAQLHSLCLGPSLDPCGYWGHC